MFSRQPSFERRMSESHVERMAVSKSLPGPQGKLQRRGLMINKFTDYQKMPFLMEGC